MGVGVLILGHSGSGKSASMRNCTPDRFGVINVQGKPLPFKSELKTYNTDVYTDVIKALQKDLPSFVIDEPEMTEEDYEGRWADEQRGIDRDLAEMY